MKSFHVKDQLKLIRQKMKWKGSDRIFCLSAQRTGTTSVGQFFKHFGYPVADWDVGWKNQWTKAWFHEDYDAIFKSLDFRSAQVFEDDPWWLPGFYHILYHRFPNSKFILFERDSEEWFQSMLAHSNGRNPGNTLMHSRIYQRGKDYERQVPSKEGYVPNEDDIDNLLSIEGHEAHYRRLYEKWNSEVRSFFEGHDSTRLFQARLDDPEKWQKMGVFFQIDVPHNFDVHMNRTKEK